MTPSPPGCGLERQQRVGRTAGRGPAPATRGFHVQPRRWVIERTLGWLMHHRRLARDYETQPHRSAAMIQLAAINLMTRRLTHESTPNWRNS
ncbi:transposase [Streptomyces sp. NPDC002688]|uniref:transposase n=1 Tax=Streptomyces sp. NPDC002688 TaxID=3154423 RepID=UPI00331818B6